MVIDTSPRATTPPITRVPVKWTSDEKPPWSGIEFTFPIGSDALSDVLRSKYPQGSDLRERKHMAAIDFLKFELRQMQARQASLAASENEYLTTSEAPSPYSDAAGGRNLQARRFSSRDTDSTTRRSMSLAHISQQPQSATPAPTMPSPTKPGEQIVFSVLDGRPQQPRTKRPMTKKEKAAYKKTRERGACPSCRRHKAKCTHVGGIYEALSGQEFGLKTPKRLLSVDASIEQKEARKSFKPASPDPETRIERSLSSGSYAVRAEPHDTAPGFTDHSNHNASIDEHAPWMPVATQGLQAEIPRYVQNQSTFQPHSVAIPSQSGTPWLGFYSSPGTNPYGPGYGQFHGPDNLENLQTIPPTETIPNQDPSGRSAFSEFLQDPWNGSQEHQPASAEPD